MFHKIGSGVARQALVALRAAVMMGLGGLGLPSAVALAQPVSAIGQAFSISFVEVQTEEGAPGRIVRQKNAVRVTVRPFEQFDFERERNTGSISKAFTYGMATGTAGSWMTVNKAARVRATMSGRAVVIDQHIFNFTQRFVITTDGKTCAAVITYIHDAGQLAPATFELIGILSKKPLRLTSLSAANITCSVGSTAIY